MNPSGGSRLGLSDVSGWLLGGVFGASAVLKALSWQDFAVQVSYYGMVQSAWALRLTALSLIALEAGIGAALLLRWQLHRIVLPLTGALLVVFSLVVGWAWVFRDIQNCGCFGKYLPMGPADSIVKNLLMLAVTALLWHRTAERGIRGVGDGSGTARPARADRPAGGWAQLARSCRGLVICGAAFASVGLAMTLSPWTVPSGASGIFPADHLTDGSRPMDISKGRFLVALLSSSCGHCAQTVAELNTLNRYPALPPVVALVLGDDSEVKCFRQAYAPDFPVGVISPLQFFRLVGEAPPRFFLVQDGRTLRYWDGEHAPSPTALTSDRDGSR